MFQMKPVSTIQLFTVVSNKKVKLLLILYGWSYRSNYKIVIKTHPMTVHKKILYFEPVIVQ